MIRFLQSGNKATKYLLGAMLILICALMVIYLIPGLMSDTGVSRSGVVATVAGQEIRTDDVTRLAAAMQQRQGYPEFYRQFLNEQATQTLIQQAELRYEAERMGLTVSDEELRDGMRKGPYKEAFFPKGNWIGQQ